MFLQVKDVSMFDNASLSLVLKEEKQVLPTHVLLQLEKKAESILFSSCCFVNKSKGMFYPDDIRKISHKKNIEGWLGSFDFDICNKENWEHRYLPYMAMDYLEYLTNKGTLEINVFDEKVSNIHKNYPDYLLNLIAQKMRLYDVLVYLSGEVFLVKHRLNRFSNESLTAPFAFVDVMREIRGKIHEGYGRLAKIITKEDALTEDIEGKIQETLDTAQQLAKRLDDLIINYQSTFPPLNNTIGYAPTILYPTNYSQLLAY